MRVLVIGAGISGIAMGPRLKRAGIDDWRGRIVTQFDGSITLQWLLLELGRPLGTYGLRRGTGA
ncbi:hypothetical protein P3H15_19310 [Rhodococcus sp. T2V]|uniref:hypothetical protein n=1 Tax=Rhodococcus sp. T2V TaxID=3034164 RepID=UPI0023E28403|nr:hypothetical protein [Rhodococcus sp. T2V]MDF3307178.1 hypothetical protein [Rhodococcus sp. T2V]